MKGMVARRDFPPPFLFLYSSPGFPFFSYVFEASIGIGAYIRIIHIGIKLGVFFKAQV